LYAAWVGSTWCGAGLGSTLADPRSYALDFAFPGAFIALLIPQLKGRAVRAAAVAAAAASLLGCAYIPGNWYLILAIGAGAVVGLGVERCAKQELSERASG